jgi:hypothetical protein
VQFAKWRKRLHKACDQPVELVALSMSTICGFGFAVSCAKYRRCEPEEADVVLFNSGGPVRKP